MYVNGRIVFFIFYTFYFTEIYQYSNRYSNFYFIRHINNNECFQDPKIYVDTILSVHKKYNALVLTEFQNDTGFVAALDKACRTYINTNAVTKAANSGSKSPELLAKYCDVLLKKSSKNPEEAELEDKLNQVVCIDSIDVTVIIIMP